MGAVALAASSLPTRPIASALRSNARTWARSSMPPTNGCSTRTCWPIPTRCVCGSTRRARPTSRCPPCARARGRWWPTRIFTRSRRPSTKRCSPTPRPRPTCRSSLARHCPPADGARGLRARAERDHAGAPDPKGSQQPSAHRQVLQGSDRGRYGPGRVPARASSTTWPGVTWVNALDALRDDEFALDPTRLTLVCGTAGYDGTAFKNLLAAKYDIQLNKTSRNSILLQTNITTR